MRRTSALLSLAAAALGCGADSALSIRDPNENPPLGPSGPTGNSNVNFGGAQDFGYFRALVEAGVVPRSEDVDAAGFFAEHHTPLPEPSCGQRVCLQAMVGSMGNLITGAECTLLQLGLNSPVVVDPEQRPPLSLAVVIDVSGSMNQDGKIAFVRSGLARLIPELKDGDRIALITYDSRARVIFPMANVEGNREVLLALVAGLLADGPTNLWGGLDLGYQEIEASFDPARQNRVILLSDGEPTAGEVNTARILELSAAYNTDGIGLTTIGLGADFNLALMRGLAEQGDGNFYFLESGAAVEEVFTEEVAYFTVPLAFELELTVDAGADFRFVSAFGASTFQADEQGGTLKMPSVFLAGRKAHDDVTPDGGRRGGGSALLLELASSGGSTQTPGYSEVAILHLSYQDGLTRALHQEVLTVSFPFETWALDEGGFFDNDLVTKSFVMLNVLIGLQTACDEFHQGDRDRAVITLRRLAAAVEDYNLEVGDVDIRYDLELIRALDAVMIEQGATDPENPPIPANPWPRD